MNLKQLTFQKRVDNLFIQCFLRKQLIIIYIKKDNEDLECQFTSQQMNHQLKDIFQSIEIFYQCFKRICEEWNALNKYVFVDSNNILEISYTQKVMKVEAKRKIFLKTHPRKLEQPLPVKLTPETAHHGPQNEMKPQQIQTLVMNQNSLAEMQVCIKQIWNQTKRSCNKIWELSTENEQLRAALKQMQYEIYRLSLRNNELTSNLNEVSHLSNKHFEMVEQFLKQIDRKTEIQKIKLNEEMVKMMKTKTVDTNEIIVQIKKQSNQELESLKQQLMTINNKVYISPLKFQFVVNFQTPFINRYRVEGSLITKTNADKKTQLVGEQPFPNLGKHYFMVKNVSIPHNYIHIGVIAQSRANQETSNFDPLCINYWGGNGCINNQGNGQLVGREFKYRQTMIVVVDMNEGVVRWVIADVQIAMADMGELRKEVLIPYIEMMHKDSKIQLNK